MVYNAKNANLMAADSADTEKIGGTCGGWTIYVFF